MTQYERIDERDIFDGPVRDSHELRYHIASGFVQDGDKVLDAGCGVGYGRNILKKVRNIEYIGLDRNLPHSDKDDGVDFCYCDFEDKKWMESQVPYIFDVFIGLEIIEHLDPVGYFIKLAKNARKWIIVSTPIVPNSNPYHKQQFTEDMMVAMFSSDGWRHFSTIYQGRNYGIFIFKRA
jgi:2-polyprenyl-3-methyl-5-hydroxy-6-metoxy-1,4-benzoquinol methylase